jgi:hypothetical protein
MMAQRIPLGKSCEMCGSSEFLVRHHSNYDEPLKVTTLCQSCHMKVHIMKSTRRKLRKLRGKVG